MIPSPTFKYLRTDSGCVGHRRGGAYIAVLGIGLLVVTVGIAALASARVRARSSDLTMDAVLAREYARAAVEHGRAYIAGNASWRSARANGIWANKQTWGKGTFTLDVQNPSGSLNRSDLDSVVLTGTGTKGLASQTLSVRLDAARTPLSCLAVPMSGGGLVTLTASTLTSTGGPITSNAGITSVLATINGDVEACALIVGTGFRGTTTSGVAARQLPAATVADTYIALGTPIVHASLSKISGIRGFEKIVLSPRFNPAGTSNALGVYVIDCQNQAFVIDSCRIVGTLVVLNPGLGSEIRGSVNWTPAVDNYPCLIVMGNLAINTSSTTLSESSLNTNFNPDGNPYPYPGGVTDTTQTTSYPSVFDGLVYISGNLTTSNGPQIDTLVVGGTVGIGGSVKLDFDSKYFTNPPPGFYTLQMGLAPGSWQRVVSP